MTTPLPTAAAFGDLMSLLVGKRTKVTQGKPLATPIARAVATYRNAENALVYVATKVCLSAVR